jgi:5-methylphenazine-1-carboxylate 1-monooxygenase
VTDARPDVLIAGGGIGGLTAALSTHAAGIDALVVEHVREIRPLGVGINIHPHAVRELTELGLGAALAATAISNAELVRTDRLGNQLVAEPRGTEGGHPWPQYSVHRGELQTLLLAAVRERLGPAAVRTGTRLLGCIQDAAGVRVSVLDRVTGQTTEIEAGVLVGADGLHSTVRALLHPDEGPLSWSGVRMWRGMTEGTPFRAGRSMVIARDGGRKFLAYPISRQAADRGRALVNWVAMVRVGEPGPLGEDASWHRVGRHADVLPYFRDWDLGPLDVPELISATEQILEYPMVDRDPLPWWGNGRVTLLGDAAHPMYPIGANGGSQAIIDAAVLAAELATAADPAHGLAAYEDKRRDATAAIVLSGRTSEARSRAQPR